MPLYSSTLARIDVSRASLGGLSEGWTGTNGAAWPARWTTFGATADIQSNAGRALTAASAYGYAGGYTTGRSNGVLLVKWQWSVAAAERYVGFGFRFGTTPEVDGYEVLINGTGSSIRRYIASAITDVASASAVLATATWYWTRVAWSGSTLQSRTWADGGAEPGTWALSATDATHTSAGQVMLRGMTGAGGAAQTTLFDDLRLTP